MNTVGNLTQWYYYTIVLSYYRTTDAVRRWPKRRYAAPTCTFEPAYNDIGLCDISSVASAIILYKLMPQC